MQIVVANTKGGCGKSTIISALAEIIDCDIVDHDNQGTLRVISSFTRLKVPVEAHKVTKKYILHDTPPYNAIEFRGLFDVADLIIIPCKVMYPDLLSVKSMVDTLRSLKAVDKGFIVFNDVRKPYTNTYKEVKQLFFQNYNDVKKCKSELSCLTGFANVFSKKLTGKALFEIKALAKELNIL